MSGSRALRLGVISVFLGASVTACAVFEKCGLHGCAGDGEITAEVARRFSRHPELGPPNSISVRTLDRVVYLNGLVDTDQERLTAESVARRVPGVKSVENLVSTNNVSGK